VLRLFGVTNEGESVVVFVHSVRPYFYFPVTAAFTDTDAAKLVTALTTQFADLAFVEVRESAAHRQSEFVAC